MTKKLRLAGCLLEIRAITTVESSGPHRPEGSRKGTQMPTDHYIHRRNELNRQARGFLSDLLADGPQPYSTILARATEAGISLSTLLTAKVALRVESRTIDKRARWHLPAAT